MSTVNIILVGYGKSILYQLAPMIFDALLGQRGNSKVMIISPTISLIEDSFGKLTALRPEVHTSYTLLVESNTCPC